MVIPTMAVLSVAYPVTLLRFEVKAKNNWSPPIFWSIYSITFTTTCAEGVLALVVDLRRATVIEYDPRKIITIEESIFSCTLASTGFQASNLGDAIKVVNQMLDWRLSHKVVMEDCSEEERLLDFRESMRCKVFLGFTSNLISSGVRETVRYLVEHRMVDVVVTTAGGIEEDLIKCLAPTYKGDFSLPGAYLRSKGLNRIACCPACCPMLRPNWHSHRCSELDMFDSVLIFVVVIFFFLQKVLWTPSKVISRLGKEINHPSSYLHWAYKNGIPVYCPGLTDGSLGDLLYFHSYRNHGLIIDVVQAKFYIRAMNGEAVYARPKKTGMIILGGGLPRHHICNANMFRNGADYAVFINTAQEFDGSDSGTRPDEAVSWGKIRGSAETVKVCVLLLYSFLPLFFAFFGAFVFSRKKEDLLLEDI
ncbi:hypothetical protein GIB67_040550 [Kingdonia uniflora]|uniref:Deoxyhypusine synthase n=1 Tax=Kingdonia uniflora TaxID=39325 RepID=A0A7J7L5J6_9MAGN|nr:hypothetical protein GIB67_040550 [Kingdonia uniflora]